MSKGREIYFVTWLRAMAVVLILYTIVFNCFSNFKCWSSIFFMISGVLFGIRCRTKYLIRWYVKRIKRIYVPYELFLVILFVLHLIIRRKNKCYSMVKDSARNSWI